MPVDGIQADLRFLSRRALLLVSHEIDEMVEFVPAVTAKVLMMKELSRQITEYL